MPAFGLSALTLCIRRRPIGAPPPALATLQVQWTDESAIEDAFRIRWIPTAGGTELQADTPPNTETHTITGLQWNTQYDVEITAVNGVGESDVLGPVALYTPPPTAPTLCTATATGATTATIGWTLPGTEPVTGYRVYRSPAGAGTWTAVGTVAAGVNTYAATGLTASTAYDWRVTGYNSNAASSQPDSETDPTNTATCTTSAPAGAWAYSLQQADINSSGEVFTNVLRNTPITLTAGNVTKLAAWAATHNAGRNWRIGLYNASRVLIASGTITKSATGWNEVSITPVAVTAGSYIMALNAVLGGDHTGLSTTVGTRALKNGTYTSMPDPLPANDGGSSTGAFATRAYVE